MKKIKLLSGFLFAGLALSFVLPLSITNANNDVNQVSNSQTINLNQNGSGDVSYRCKNAIGGAYTAIIHMNTIANLTPQTIRYSANYWWNDPNNDYFSYTSATSGVHPHYVHIDNINQSTGLVDVTFVAADNVFGEFENSYHNHIYIHFNAAVPSFTVNTKGKETYVGDINAGNILSYVDKHDGNNSLIKVSKVTPNDYDGSLVLEEIYYATTYHGDQASTRTVSLTVTGFAAKIDKPTFSINTSTAQTVAPSTLNNNNYKTYLNVNDPKNSLKGNVNFNPDDSNGTLTVSGEYYSATNHAKTGTYSYNLSGFARSDSKPTITTNARTKEVLASQINSSNYTTYLSVTDSSKSLIASGIKFSNQNDKNGTLTVSGTYYTTTYHASGAPTDTYSYNLSGFAIADDPPTIQVNASGKKDLPSVVTNSNYTNYLDISDTSAIANVDTLTPNNDDGTLKMSVNYYNTTSHTTGSPTSPHTYNINGFASAQTQPNITVNALGKTVLPSIVTPSNYTKYLDISDSSEIANVISTTSHDNDGILEFIVNYYTTSYHGSGAPVKSHPYVLSGFAKNENPPQVTINNLGTTVLPSVVTTSNYNQYLTISDPTAIANVDSVKSDNSTGTLKMSVNYYNTSSHTTGSPTSAHTYTIGDFAKTSNKPTITVNSKGQTVLASVVTASNYNQYLNVSDQSSIVSVVSLSSNDNNGTLVFKIKYYTTTSHTSGSPTADYSYNLTGFAKPVSAPTITINEAGKKVLPSVVTTSNYNQYLTISDPSAIANADSVKSDNKAGTLEISVNYYNTSSHAIGSSTSPKTYIISGFAKGQSEPKITINSLGKTVLPSQVTTSNYAQYLNVSDPTAISEIVSAIGHDDTGILDFRIKYYTTTNHNPGSPDVFYTYSIHGFKHETSKVTISDNNKDRSTILPSTVTVNQVAQYINVSGGTVDNYVIDNHDDNAGTITVHGVYKKYSSGSETITTNTITLNGFNYKMGAVSISDNGVSRSTILPSTVTTTQVSQWIRISGGTVDSYVIDNFDDNKGTLSVHGLYKESASSTTSTKSTNSITLNNFSHKMGTVSISDNNVDRSTIEAHSINTNNVAQYINVSGGTVDSYVIDNHDDNAGTITVHGVYKKYSSGSETITTNKITLNGFNHKMGVVSISDNGVSRSTILPNNVTKTQVNQWIITSGGTVDNYVIDNRDDNAGTITVHGVYKENFGDTTANQPTNSITLTNFGYKNPKVIISQSEAQTSKVNPMSFEIDEHGIVKTSQLEEFIHIKDDVDVTISQYHVVFSAENPGEMTVYGLYDTYSFGPGTQPEKTNTITLSGFAIGPLPPTPTPNSNSHRNLYILIGTIIATVLLIIFLILLFTILKKQKDEEEKSRRLVKSYQNNGRSGATTRNRNSLNKNGTIRVNKLSSAAAAGATNSRAQLNPSLKGNSQLSAAVKNQESNSRTTTGTKTATNSRNRTQASATARTTNSRNRTQASATARTTNSRTTRSTTTNRSTTSSNRTKGNQSANATSSRSRLNSSTNKLNQNSSATKTQATRAASSTNQAVKWSTNNSSTTRKRRPSTNQNANWGRAVGQNVSRNNDKGPVNFKDIRLDPEA